MTPPTLSPEDEALLAAAGFTADPAHPGWWIDTCGRGRAITAVALRRARADLTRNGATSMSTTEDDLHEAEVRLLNLRLRVRREHLSTGRRVSPDSPVERLVGEAMVALRRLRLVLGEARLPPVVEREPRASLPSSPPTAFAGTEARPVARPGGTLQKLRGLPPTRGPR